MLLSRSDPEQVFKVCPCAVAQPPVTLVVGVAHNRELG